MRNSTTKTILLYLIGMSVVKIMALFYFLYATSTVFDHTEAEVLAAVILLDAGLIMVAYHIAKRHERETYDKCKHTRHNQVSQ